MSKALLSISTLLGAGAIAAGCGGDDDDAQNAVRLVGNEYAFVIDDEIEGEVVSFEVVNEGDELHEYALGRVKGDATVEELKQAFTSGSEEATKGLVDDVGGVPLLSPGQQITITRELRQGRYVLLCFIPAPDGEPHIVKGMIDVFEIQGDSGADLPEADATISASASGYDIPEVEAGERTIELRNADSTPREFFLLSLEPGKTISDVDTWGEDGLKGTPPATFYGAMQTIPPGSSVYLTAELEEGKEYTLLDGEKQAQARFTPN